MTFITTNRYSIIIDTNIGTSQYFFSINFNSIASFFTKDFYMSVDTFKIIQDRLKATDYFMAKSLEVTQTNYKYIRDIAFSVKLPVLIKGWELAEKAGFSLKEYWGLLRDDSVKYDEFEAVTKKKVRKR